MTTIGFIGAGNMGEALIRGLVGRKVVRPSDLWISEPDVRAARAWSRGTASRRPPTTPTSRAAARWSSSR